jgi:hypothetical protein
MMSFTIAPNGTVAALSAIGKEFARQDGEEG